MPGLPRPQAPPEEVKRAQAAEQPWQGQNLGWKGRGRHSLLSAGSILLRSYCPGRLSHSRIPLLWSSESAAVARLPYSHEGPTRSKRPNWPRCPPPKSGCPLPARAGIIPEAIKDAGQAGNEEGHVGASGIPIRKSGMGSVMRQFFPRTCRFSSGCWSGGAAELHGHRHGIPLPDPLSDHPTGSVHRSGRTDLHASGHRRPDRPDRGRPNGGSLRPKADDGVRPALPRACVSLGYTQAGSFEQFVLLAGIGGFSGALFQPASPRRWWSIWSASSAGPRHSG